MKHKKKKKKDHVSDNQDFAKLKSERFNMYGYGVFPW